MPLLLDLFLTFAKIGLFTFGGGYAMLSIIENNCAERKQWVTHEEIIQMTIIAESTPGPIAINCATFTGYKKAGLTGALVATIGMVLPSFIVIYPISLLLDHFLEITLIANAFKGIKIGVGILILRTAYQMVKKTKQTTMSRWFMFCSCLVMLCVNFFSLHFSTISLLLIGAIVSLVLYLPRSLFLKKGGEQK